MTPVGAPLDRRSFVLSAAAASVAISGARGTTITLVGYNDMREMLTALSTAFSLRQPSIRVMMDLPGTRSAPYALASGRANLAPMGARFTPEQLDKFVNATGRYPIGFAIAHASLDPKALSGPNGIFVHEDNPLRAIDLGSLARLFTKPGPHRWGDLSVAGALGDRAIVITGMAPQTPLALEFREEAFPSAAFTADYRGFGQSRDVIEFIGGEPAALGFAAMNRATGKVRSLAIRRQLGLPPIEATPDNLRAGLYPLDRKLWIYARRDKAGRVSGVARDYLRFALSRQGQTIIGGGTLGYLPLGERERRLELAKLG